MDLRKHASVVEDFLSQHPELSQLKRTKGATRPFTKSEIFEKLQSGRELKWPELPSTISDPMVGLILEHYFSVDLKNIGAAIKTHKMAMAAENVIGYLLEAYINTKLSGLGWIWCCGNVVKHVDFIKQIASSKYLMIQVKNRSNSENSSSSTVRGGTDILKWYRTHHLKAETNWHNFPEVEARKHLNEDEFKQFVVDLMRKK